MRDVLELVDQNVAERADIAASLGVARGAQDHVLEIDPTAESLLLFLEDWREHVEKRLGPLAQLHPLGLGLAIFDAVAAALELRKGLLTGMRSYRKGAKSSVRKPPSISFSDISAVFNSPAIEIMLRAISPLMAGNSVEID